MKRGRGRMFYSKLEKEVKNNFPTMKTVESEIRRNPSVRDPFTKRTVKSVIWPPTDKEKIIPISRKFAKGILKNFNFWAYDPKMAEAAIVTEEQLIGIPDTFDPTSFHEEDILVLNQHQIRTNNKYEECAKSWTDAVTNIVRNRLFADPNPDLGGPQV
ncbi:hypothetical protein Hanom_Chr03g00213851 [Helianthus anomalus]